MPELQRITTEYIEAEDRMRIAGALEANETVVIWVSQRLLVRLLPHLFGWLEKQVGSGVPLDIGQQFEQEAATASLTHEKPVVRERNAKEWLVAAVDLSSSQNSLIMQFRAEGEQPITLTMTPQALRQWLSILLTLWRVAEWPIGSWPQWITNTEASKKSSNTAIH